MLNTRNYVTEKPFLLIRNNVVVVVGGGGGGGVGWEVVYYI